MWVLVPALNPVACHRNRAFIPLYSNSLFIIIILLLLSDDDDDHQLAKLHDGELIATESKGWKCHGGDFLSQKLGAKLWNRKSINQWITHSLTGTGWKICYIAHQQIKCADFLSLCFFCEKISIFQCWSHLVGALWCSCRFPRSGHQHPAGIANCA